jgi:GR25 family glycosyltransferase involved in LPS biosynthesis
MRVFFHVAAMNNSWYNIYREIYNEIADSGLLEACSKLTVGFIGPVPDFAKIAEELVGDKYELVYFGPDFTQYEFPTLELLDKYCREGGTEPVMYCHTKGVSAPDHVGKTYWRRAMIKAVISDWKRCNKLLLENDLVGYNLHRPRHKGSAPIHFSGNWWWVKPEYITKCLPISLLRKTPKFISHWLGHQLRFQCEFWLRTGPWLQAKWKSTGVENADRENIIDPITSIDPAVKDPFDYAGIQVDRRFVINMTGQDDRLESALTEISKAQIRDVEVFEAIVPDNTWYNPLKTKGQLGCYLSNFACIKEAYESDAEAVLIMEDDVEFVYRFTLLLKDCYNDLPKDWDVFFVGAYEKNRGPYEQVKNKIYKTGDHWGTHCYLLSRSGIKKMYDYLSTKPIQWEIDMLMVHHMPELVKYSIHSTLAYQKPFKSNTRPPKPSGSYATLL